VNIFVKLAPPVPSQVFETYWKFAFERQEIFFRRLRGQLAPWTTDPILLEFKFTNAYRASDRVSQYLIRNVLYKGAQSPPEVFFRCILFKVFNKETTWELLEKHGAIDSSEFSYKRASDVLNSALAKGQRIFSAAYIMPSRGKGFSEKRKHRNFLALLGRMMKENLADRLQGTQSMKEAYDLMRSFPMIGDFLALQFVIDLNYSTLTNFSEMEFVVPGPGARNGLRKCFISLGDFSESDTIRWVTERQDEEFNRRGLDFRRLGDRPLQLIDCQNLFCEVDKYSRVAHPEISHGGRTRIKQKFAACSQIIGYFFPPKWNISDLRRKS
jgi:hypothetical protein